MTLSQTKKFRCNVLMVFLMTILGSHIYADSTGAIEVTDYLGRKVSLENPAQRIVALAPHIVENLYSSRAGDKIVGAVHYSDYPPSAQNIPRVGSAYTFNLEAILAKQPDLVVLWHTGRAADYLQKLKALGITVYASDPLTLPDIARSIRDFGVLTGNRSEADKVAAEFEQRLSLLQQRYLHAEKIGVFYQIWHEPIQTLNGKHLISDVLKLCGGENVFFDALAVAPKVSIEAVIAANPKAIIGSDSEGTRPEWLDNWKRWPAIDAVQNNHLFYVHPDKLQRHSVRILDGVERVCEHLDAVRQTQ